MPKYNIELRTADTVSDTFHVECGDQTALRIEIRRFVGELLKDHAEEIWKDEEWRVDATDENGLILFMMHLSVTDSPAAIPLG